MNLDVMQFDCYSLGTPYFFCSLALGKYEFYLSFELILTNFEFSKYFGLNGLDKWQLTDYQYLDA